jgi:hypothetical protein
MTNRPGDKSHTSPLSITPADDVSQVQAVGRDLLTVDVATGEYPRVRLRNAQAAHNLFLILLQADRKSAYNRAVLQEMRDGAPPQSDAALQQAGMSWVYNLNFLESDTRMAAALASYDDLVESTETLIVPHFQPGVVDPEDIADVGDIIAEEYSMMIRENSDFYSQWNRLANEFVGHGVGWTYFPDAETPWWETGGWDLVLIPRKTRAKDEAVAVFITRHEYRVGDLYEYISNPKYAKGWNEMEVQKAIVQAARGNRNIRRWFDHWPEVERELKNNDLGFGFGDAELVYAVHYFVKEFDGTYSFYIGLENGTNQDYLYSDPRRYKNAAQAFTSFTLEIGNGTLHSIRGALWKMFPFVQTSNRFRNKLLTNTDISLTLLLQGEEGDSYDDLQLTLGPAVGYLPPSAKVIDRTLPDVGTQGLPIVKDLSQTLQAASGQFHTPSTPYPVQEKASAPTKYELQSHQSAEGLLTSNSVNRFYRSVDRVFQEQFRRVQEIGATGGRAAGGKVRFPEIEEFFARCAERGVTEDIIKAVRKVSAQRAIGNGSPQLRLLAYDELLQMSGELDETGRSLAVRDRISDRFGRQFADRYKPKVQRVPPDASLATVENAALKSDLFSALPDQNHAVHASIHVPKFQDIVEQIVQYRETNPEADFAPMEPQLTWALNLHSHASDHVVAMAANPLRLGEMKSYRAALEQGGNLLAGFARELQQQERHAAGTAQTPESPATAVPGAVQGQPGQSQQDQITASDPKLAMEAERHKVELQMSLEKHQKDMQLASAKVAQIAQEMRIKMIKADAEIAEGIRARQTSEPEQAVV